MIKKILLPCLILFCLLAVSAIPVSAADEYKKFTDDEDDVSDLEGSMTSSKPNIDIVEIEFSKTGREVTLTLTVNGEIENLGNIDNIDSPPLIAYNVILSLTESESEYEILYINNKAQLNGEEDDIEFDVDGSSIEFIFDAETSSEELVDIIALTTEASDFTNFYLDEFFSTQLTVNAGGPYDGEVGESIEFKGSVGSEGTPPYEWEWDFGDGEYSSEQNPTHVYSEAGTYEVTLYVSDVDVNFGFDSATATITGGSNGNGGNGNNGDQNKEESGSNTGLIIFVVLIVIIIVAAIGAVVYVTRK